jgi:hypothetical protein
MSRKSNGNGYEFVGIRDRGDGVIGPRDLIILKDQAGRRMNIIWATIRPVIFSMPWAWRSRSFPG